MPQFHSIHPEPLSFIIPPIPPRQSITLTFLPPNTHLDDHLINQVANSVIGAVPNQPSASGVFAFDYSSPQTPRLKSNINFVNIKTVHKIQGQYHNLPISEFEDNPCSYSLGESVVPQAFFLDQLFPKSLDDILSTKEEPIVRGPAKKRQKKAHPEFVTFSGQVDTVKDWELANESLLNQGPVAPEIRNAINHTLEPLKWPQKSSHSRIDWESGQAFTWFNPPWQSNSAYNFKRGQHYSQNVKRGRQEIKPKAYTKIKHFKTRKLTHLKGDFETLDDPTGVPVVDLEDVAAGRKGKKFRMSSDEENRFVIAHIAIGTIAGGLSKVNDSILMARLFPMYTLNKIRQLWCKIKKCRGKELPIIEAKFQEAFLEGYENGELPALNYDDLISYGWSCVIDWYMRKYPVVSGGDLPEGLPSTRSALLETYNIEDMQATENWRDTFLVKSHAASKVKRHQVSAQDQLTVPIHSEPSRIAKISHAEVAKSVVKAAIATPGETYNQHVAEAELQKIGDAAVTKARDELLKDGSIKHKYRGRAVPRQPYHITEAFSKPLVRESIKASNWQEALEYKQKLDAAFRKGEIVKIEKKESDGAFMCITNLLAHNRVRLIQSQVPISKYGLLVNGYETNSIDKNQLLFVLEIAKTDSYLYNEDILLSTTGKLVAPRGIGTAIPSWLDINGDLIPEFWVKAQKGLFSALALRSGANLEELLRVFKLSLVDWEVKLLLKWGVENGSVVGIGKGFEGWSTGEWWWLFPSLGVGI